MDRESLARIVLEVVQAQAVIPAAEIREDTPLGAGGLGIDSIGCLELILELERRTGLVLRDEQLTAASLATPGSLIDHLLRSGRC